MRYRNYIIQLKDKSAFYVSEEDGKKSIGHYANGKAIFVRGRMIAHALVGVIRPCNVEEDNEAEEVKQTEKRILEIESGELKITKSGDKFLLISSKTDDESMQKMLT